MHSLDTLTPPFLHTKKSLTSHTPLQKNCYKLKKHFIIKVGLQEGTDERSVRNGRKEESSFDDLVMGGTGLRGKTCEVKDLC